MSARRKRYQSGSLTLKRGRTWEYRWNEVQIDGTTRRRSAVIGTIDEYQNESAAQAAADSIRIEINRQTPQQLIKQISVETLVSHYRQHELPDVFSGQKPGLEVNEDESRKAYSTQSAYDHYLSNWILPRWRSHRLSEIRAVDVEGWLKKVLLTRGSKAKIRNIMSALYAHAIRWRWIDQNPIRSVRQSAKRTKVPVPLKVEQIAAGLALMKLVMLVATHLDVFTGLRRGELIGLKWEDIDFEVLAVKPKRSVVNMVGGKLKTEESGKSIPLDVETAEILLAWKRQSLYNQPSDWVFASPIKNGAQPYWPDSLWKRYGRPAFVAAGVTTPVAYHTFRHSLATLMMANGEDVKTVQTMLRHATSAITLNTYAHGVTSKQREAQNKVVAMVRKASA